MKNSISVVIRSFNESKWIRICLENLVSQSLKPSEILLIDNMSDDGTIQIAKNSFNKIKVFKYNKEYTPGKMLNFGISKCKGDYILIISAHCVPCDNELIKNF